MEAKDEEIEEGLEAPVLSGKSRFLLDVYCLISGLLIALPFLS